MGVLAVIGLVALRVLTCFYLSAQTNCKSKNAAVSLHCHQQVAN